MQKFRPAEVGFKPEGGEEYPCGKCLHFYVGRAAKRAVCEIMRIPGEMSVPPEGYCAWWTKDGEEFPRQDEGE